MPSVPAGTAPAAPTVPGVYQVRVDGRVFTVDVLPIADGASAQPASGPAPAPVSAPSAAPAAAPVGVPVSGAKTLPSPLQGSVSRLLVKVGDRVQVNQPVVILEAMKMENEITSPFAGVVRQILAREGQSVDADAPLLTIE